MSDDDHPVRFPTPWYKRPRIPFGLALLSVVVTTSAAIAIPLAVLSFNGATRATDSMTEALRVQLVKSVSEDVIRLASRCFAALDDIQSLDNIGKYLAAYKVNETTKITDEPYKSLIVNDLITVASRYGLIVAYNVAGRLPAVGNAEDLLVGPLVPPGVYPARICNDLNVTHQSCDNGVWMKMGNTWDRTITFVPSPPPVPFVPNEPRKTDEALPATEAGMWMPTSIFLSQGDYKPIKACFRAPSFFDRTPPTSPTDIRMGNYTAIYSAVYELGDITKYLMTVTPTPNSVVAVFDIKDGGLVGVSKPNLTVKPANDGVVNIIDVNHRLLREAAASMHSHYGQTWTKVPDRVDMEVSTSQGQALVSLKTITTDIPLGWVVFIVIPESDLIGAMTDARKRAGIAVGITSVCAFLLAVAVSYVFVWPIKRLSLVMEAATKFDFSAVSTGGMQKRSFLLELATMEEAFAVMLRKFSTAIVANKNLASRGGGTSSMTTSRDQMAASLAASKAKLLKNLSANALPSY
ncbi:uncharacterized protein EV422DRAFT_570153 [Fimicolochytrium jonesii]|uniref:uncharacterized protein n=1 Tax=Fimicolochytrium jonesii TaxID=1396493 RepID=UPI0022FE7A90|nr:uncharacterized protein EV422DRAFT_570153 [Fimicolochytrium jonesii]KAI8818007.1 hypothetical protein EV422DRAFT_570153 [Fimicolochytrium jonesii]